MPPAKKHGQMVRAKDVYDVGYILERLPTLNYVNLKEEALDNLRRVKKDSKFMVLGDDEVNIYSLRLYTFKSKGIKCVTCGIEGQFFAKEKHINDNRYHLNLYAIDSNGDEVLMTKDHVIPKCIGGRNNLNNMQPMCKVCNENKGNEMNIKGVAT